MTVADVEIRRFLPEDWDAVCKVYDRAAKAELAVSGTDPGAFRPMPAEEDLATFLLLNTARVAVVSGRVVGFVAWRDRGAWHSSGYLSWLYVDPTYHRRGIGDQLMGTAMRALGDQAWALVKQGNDPAITLYCKHGMRIVVSTPADTDGSAFTDVRMAVPTSRKSDPDAPSFGA